MKIPLPLVLWFLRWELRRLRALILRLRRREGILSFHAEKGGPFAREAASLAAALQCILSDHLVPAADALEAALSNREPLPEEPEDDESNDEKEDDGEDAA
jgi:hypothetical protein